jgi:hypothetical protein
MIPVAAIPLLPLLAVEMARLPDVPAHIIAGQIDHESGCPNVRKCWNPKVEFKTAREHGIGVGQATIAYNADGSIRFDKPAELRAKYESLREFKGAGLYSPALQIRAVVLLNKENYDRIKGAANNHERIAFMLASYNAGLGLVNKDRLLCGNTPQCDSSRWFGNVERQGVQSKTRWQGYGKSAFEITRYYVPDILRLRSPKYASFGFTP